MYWQTWNLIVLYAYILFYSVFFFNTQQGHWKSVTVGSVENESDIRLTLRFVSWFSTVWECFVLQQAANLNTNIM